MEQLFENRELRDQVAGRIEALEKVKKLLLIPKTDFATVGQVAEYYEVDIEAVKKVIQRNNDELLSDGLIRGLNGTKTKLLIGVDNAHPHNFRGGFEFEGIRFNNKANILIHRRVILRIGMLLQESSVAAQVRAYLYSTLPENNMAPDIINTDSSKSSDELKITTLEIADMMDMPHKSIIRKLEGSPDRKGYLKILTEHQMGTSEYFKETTYKDATGKVNKCYEVTKLGCDFLANKFTGEKGVIFTAKYVKRFRAMESSLKEQSNPLLPNTYVEALEQLLITAKENDALVEQNKELEFKVDNYQRFLCEKTEHLMKSDLAVKLDTTPQRLASILRRCGIYTKKKAKVSQEFLSKYPDVKIITEYEYTYTIYGEVRTEIQWQWTHEGAKAVVDELVKRDIVKFTENDGFKVA